MVKFRKKKGKRVHFDKIPTGERGALGCRNPKTTPNHRIAFAVMASRRGDKW